MALSDTDKQKIKDEEEYRSEIRSSFLKPMGNKKSKLVAALLALFLGWLGFHKFYLGRTGWGVLYLLFFWTLVPAFISFFEAIRYLIMSDEEFNSRYS